MEARRSCRCCLGNLVGRIEELPCEWMHSFRPLLLHHLLGIHEGAEMIIPPDLGWDGFLARVYCNTGWCSPGPSRQTQSDGGTHAAGPRGQPIAVDPATPGRINRNGWVPSHAEYWSHNV